MTVADLIAALGNYEDDAKIVFRASKSDVGGYWHCEIATDKAFVWLNDDGSVSLVLPDE